MRSRALLAIQSFMKNHLIFHLTMKNGIQTVFEKCLYTTKNFSSIPFYLENLSTREKHALRKSKKLRPQRLKNFIEYRQDIQNISAARNPQFRRHVFFNIQKGEMVRNHEKNMLAPLKRKLSLSRRSGRKMNG